MVNTYNDDFSVTWADPADAELTWLYDPMHMPYPLCPAVTELWDGVYQRYMSARTVYVNGYGYATQPTPAPPTPEIVKRGVFDVWTNDYLPQIRKFCDGVRSADYDALALAALGDEMPAIIDRAVHAYGFTMKPISAFMGPTFGFVAFLEGEIGPEGPQLAATLLQGFENGTAAAGAGLSELADAAAQSPAVVDALKRADFDGLGAVEGGADFLKQFHTYLDNFGWRVDSWGTLEKPTWAENPRLPLMLIGRYMNDPARTPRAAMERSIAQREEAVRVVESKLNPDRLPAFRSMLAGVQSHVPVSEGRALWQLIITGSTRVPYLALGRRLAEAGALTRPEQVFFFRSAELRDAAHRPSSEVRATADAREAEFERWKSLTPVPFIGSPPDPTQLPPEVEPLVRLFFGMAEPQVAGQEIKGQAASKGVVTAVARVIKDLSDAERLQPGEVLVCTTTAPPWTPLFAIAAAVVTDSGGVLSHSAICAREYAIPCVVATQVATHMIPDGATITVDGAAGVVRIGG
jgi:pyruvate,water dikinase